MRKKIKDFYNYVSITEEHKGIIYQVFDSLEDYFTNIIPDSESLVEFIGSDVEDYDIEYALSHSGDKYISPLFERLLEEELDLADINIQLGYIIINKFGIKWTKIYNALMTDYAPLENYDMEEVRTPNLSKSHALMVSGTQSGSNHEEVNTNLSTRQLVDEESKDATNTDISKSTGVDTETGVYGFNSNNSNPSATGESDTTERTQGTKANNYIEKTHDADNTETVTGSKNDNYKDSTSSGTESKTESSTDTETGTETLTRHGNIGVTTSQQMLESEIKLRQYNFIEELYKDIDSILCLKIY